MPADQYPRPPLAVLFDLDGTLVDSIELILGSARYAFEGFDGTVPTDAEWLTGVGIPLRTMMRRYAPDDAGVDALIARYRVHQAEHHDRLVRCYDGVVDTLGQLRERGHPIALVTSKGDALTRRALALVGIDGFIDEIVSCDSTERHKPDPEPVIHALDRLGASPARAVFVGDSIHDMAAGKAAGVITIGALWGPFTRADLEPSRPSYYMNAITELPELLDSIDTY